MTVIKERTIDLIRHLPDEQVLYVFNILHNIEGLSQTTIKKETVLSDKQKAYQHLLKYKGTLSADFDYEKELSEAREEKYGRFD
ncbi:hypothetical protein FACS1894200_07740 [Spirochaetia bacterium]|nr:hypothetical protein FACS1894200_07740 [Spirochaetia bacterium]